MNKLLKSLCLILFPIAVFFLILLINHNLAINARYGNLTMVRFCGIFMISIASILILELIGLFLQIKKNYFSAAAWLVGALESALLTVLPFLPVWGKAQILQNLYYENTGLSIFIGLHFVATYLFMFILIPYTAERHRTT